MFPSSSECPICKSKKVISFLKIASDAPPLSDVNINIFACKSCFFQWQHPVLVNSKVSQTFFLKCYENESKNPYFSREGSFVRTNIQADYIESLKLKPTTCLDIGGGSCIFAVVLTQRGWKVTVVDPALSLCKLTEEEKSSISIVKNILSTIPPPLQDSEAYDLITMWDVIEHVEDPEALITEVKKYLSKNGVLVIETGNITSFDNIYDYLGWIYQMDHRWYFGFPSMFKFLDKESLEVIDFSKLSLRGGARKLSLYVMFKHFIRNPIKTLKSLLKIINLLRYPQNRVSIFTIACKKKI